MALKSYGPGLLCLEKHGVESVISNDTKIKNNKK